MAQLNRDGLAFALGRLYLSRGGSESDLNDVTDSADIVAKLYHLLGGNVAIPKGTTMAQLVDLLSTTQGGGGGDSAPYILKTINDVNDSEIRTQLVVDVHYDNFTNVGCTIYSDDTLFGVKMPKDTSGQYKYLFDVSVNGQRVTEIEATYNDEGGMYQATLDMSVNTTSSDQVIFVNFRSRGNVENQ